MKVILIMILLGSGWADSVLAITKPTLKLSSVIESACLRYNAIDCALVHAIVAQESGYNEKAYNNEKSGSYGLMMVQCTTARLMGLKYGCDQLFHPLINLRFGIKYLNHQIVRYDGSIKEAIAAYNAGSAIVCEFHNPGKCFPNEFVNEEYVWRVSRRYGWLKLKEEYPTLSSIK